MRVRLFGGSNVGHEVEKSEKLTQRSREDSDHRPQTADQLQNFY